MTNEFLTKGLENDRYLKAIRLIEQFENEIEAILEKFDHRMVDEQPDLFDPSTDRTIGTKRHPNSVIAFHRINHGMDGPRAPDNNQQLNVHLYWVSPTEYNRTEIDGALRAFGYKIKHADPTIDEQVVKQTRAGDWSVEMSRNPFDSNTVFYRHVSSMAEVEETMETLVSHFSEFGDAYASNRDGL